jgi:3-hydroxyacyl-CoA dehydrogenase
MSNQPTSTQYDVRGSVAVVTLNNPPVNGLGYALRSGIISGLDKALADPKVTAVVLIGSDRAFSGGADVKEFGTANAGKSPNLPDVIKALENSPKPVVAAIGGMALGGGLELAMGAHFRVAKGDANLGLPEVKLGLLPGAGGTQRLPRLIGLEAALNMIVSGAPVPAKKFEGSPLVDAIVDGDLLDGAIKFAEKAVTDKLPLKRARDLKVKPVAPGTEAFLQFARNTVGATSKNFPAPLKCVEAVATATTKPFDEGLKYERELFQASRAPCVTSSTPSAPRPRSPTCRKTPSCVTSRRSA